MAVLRRVETMIEKRAMQQSLSYRKFIARIVAAIALVVTCVHAGPAAAQVVLLVNGEPITALDIEQRSRLTQLATHKTPPRQQVINELIDDKLKLQTAKRYGLEISDHDVDAAFANLGKGMGMSGEQFAKSLQGNGVQPTTLKNRLRADIAWGQIIRGRYRASLEIGDREVDTILDTKKKDDDTAYDFTLRPILFVVPRGAPESFVETRKRDAESLRARFQSCDDGIPFARALPDVVIRDPIRRSSADLAPQLRSILNGVELGHLTPPEVTQGGVQLFAICEKKLSKIDTPDKRAAREEIFTKRFEQQSKRYLKELRDGAMIEYK
jgi:peptidyl-prolyl cis-trans isomerase SurA